MFIGEYQHSIDKKGRLILPAKIREVITEKYVESFIITRGLDKCLYVYPIDEWKSTVEPKIKALSEAEPNARYYKRMLYANAAEVPIDKQGRIMIPHHLRERNNIGRDVVIIGDSNRIEIWGKDNWEAYLKGQEGQGKSFEDIVKDLQI
ncbi:MAG: division/cell wall cluster transcriptional repressor MraZ [Candidatus Firestonebacteria bacterium]